MLSASLSLLVDSAEPVGAAAPARPMAQTPVWPSSDILAALQDMLLGYYNQEAGSTAGQQDLAPESEADKRRAAKDPDTLWEALAARSASSIPGLMPRCHAAETPAQYRACTGMRLARATNLGVSDGSNLFRPTKGYYEHQELVLTAGYFALYHAFVRDFDAPLQGSCRNLPPERVRRQYQCYHERMIRAYEAHMRDLLVQMFSQRRDDPAYQRDLTRGAGWLATPYTSTVQAMEEYGLWQTPADRRDAIALLNGLGQRIWWEWVIPQPDGPRTAGEARIGNRGTYEDAIARDPSLQGTHRFSQGSTMIESLRPAAPGWNSLWFDADYTVPGEDWCKRFEQHSADWDKCMRSAKRESLGGDRSPFGSYFGLGDCSRRSPHPTGRLCGETNLGSIAEEWMATYVGARGALRVVQQVNAVQDRDAPPAGSVLQFAFEAVNARLGFGVAGFHGGEGRQDDMEWPFPLGRPDVVAIRTLSAALHDTEKQNGRSSLGELDITAVSTMNNGDTWDIGGEEYPGAIENHAPGPNPLYGSALFGLVLSDKVDGGMSPTLYDNQDRNHPDEFDSWVWLLQSTYYRCRNIADPVDDQCFSFSPDLWPHPGSIRREPLFVDPDDDSVPIGLRYLWRRPQMPLSSESVADATAAGRGQGLPWASLEEYGVEEANGDVLVAEQGYGAWGLMLQGAGGFMRLAAARYAEASSSPSLAEDYRLRRDEVIKPWYDELHRLVLGILHRFSDPLSGYGYLPDIENARRIHNDGEPVMVSWYLGGDNATADGAIAHRAKLYSTAALWYWMYDSNWLDVDGRWTGEIVPSPTPIVTQIPTAGPSPTSTRRPSATPTLSPSPTASATRVPTLGPSPTPTATPAVPATRTPTTPQLPTATPTFKADALRYAHARSDLWFLRSAESGRPVQTDVTACDYWGSDCLALGSFGLKGGQSRHLRLASVPALHGGLFKLGLTVGTGESMGLMSEVFFSAVDADARIRSSGLDSATRQFIPLGNREDGLLTLFNPSDFSRAELVVYSHVGADQKAHRLDLEPLAGTVIMLPELLGPGFGSPEPTWLLVDSTLPVLAQALVSTADGVYDVPGTSSEARMIPLVFNGFDAGRGVTLSSEVWVVNASASMIDRNLAFATDGPLITPDHCLGLNVGLGSISLPPFSAEELQIPDRDPVSGRSLRGCIGHISVDQDGVSAALNLVHAQAVSGDSVAAVVASAPIPGSSAFPILRDADTDTNPWWMAAWNTGDRAATVTLELFDRDGEPQTCRLPCSASVPTQGLQLWSHEDLRFVGAGKPLAAVLRDWGSAAMLSFPDGFDGGLTAYSASARSLSALLPNDTRWLDGSGAMLPTLAPTSQSASPTPDISPTALPTKTATRIPLPTATPIASPCQEVVRNGDFELPFIGYWSGNARLVTQGCRAGNCARIRAPGSAYLRQLLTIPFDASAAYISYWLRAETSSSVSAITWQGSVPRVWDHFSALDPAEGWVLSGYPMYRRERSISEIGVTLEQGQVLVDELSIFSCQGDPPNWPDLRITTQRPLTSSPINFRASGFEPREPVVAWIVDPLGARINRVSTSADNEGEVDADILIDSDGTGEWYLGIIGERSRVPGGVYFDVQ